MGYTVFNKQYFKTYLERGWIFKSIRGDRDSMYSYWIRFLKKNFPMESDVLEVGCGLGFFGRRLQKLYSYIGLDISADALSYACEVNKIKKLIHGEADVLPFERDCFDIVIAFDVVEHLKVPMIFFKEAHRVLRPSGIIIVRTPNTYSFGVKKKSKSKSLIPSMKKDTSHVSLYAPAVWMDMIQNAGFTITRWGTDTLWDIPYFEHIPLLIQKIIFIPFNLVIFTLFGYLKWNQGENLIIIGRK